jgi:hypothetical protein
MTNEAFNRGFSALSQVFPALNLDAKLFWGMLNDLDGEFFLKATFNFIKTTTNIYPGTNIIAVIRENAATLQNQFRQENVLKLEAETEKERIDRWQKEAAPMPEECRMTLKKLGIKIGMEEK